MKRIFAMFTIILAVSGASCLRERQTESLLDATNSNLFRAELVRCAAKANVPFNKRVGVVSALKEGDSVSPRTSGIARTVGNYYAFTSDDMSEHQKIMIDDFLKDAINRENNIVRVTNEQDGDLLVVAYIRSYTWHRYLHFDIFDMNAKSQIGNVKYELSKMSTSVEGIESSAKKTKK